MKIMIKKLTIIILMIATSFSVNAQFQLEEDYSFKADKQLHALGGIAVSGTTFILVYNKTGDEALAKRAGIIAGVSAGTIKEMLDFTAGGEPSVADLLYTSIFSVATSLTMQVIVKHRKKKKKERKTYSAINYSLDNKIFINNKN